MLNSQLIIILFLYLQNLNFLGLYLTVNSPSVRPSVHLPVTSQLWLAVIISHFVHLHLDTNLNTKLTTCYDVKPHNRMLLQSSVMDTDWVTIHEIWENKTHLCNETVTSRWHCFHDILQPTGCVFNSPWPALLQNTNYTNVCF